MCGERGVVVKTHDQPPWFIPACAGNARTRRTPGSVAPVHPRMRGERSGSICARLTSSGSSPHARGTLFASAHNVPSCRFIPAYAGNATPGACWSCSHAGSSPHTRGTQSGSLCRLPYLRFIPAYAGNASATSDSRLTTPVHPRIRGERAGGRNTPKKQSRFIPAYAGNAPLRAKGARLTAVHPRIRGERRSRPASASLTAGSSPHTRGTRLAHQRNSSARRFIPAYAGNAASVLSPSWPASVHPRIRGERFVVVDADMMFSGSSPHTRGTLSPDEPLQARRRFIPAYAGNATLAPVEYALLTVHPRIRGER